VNGYDASPRFFLTQRCCAGRSVTTESIASCWLWPRRRWIIGLYCHECACSSFIITRFLRELEELFILRKRWNHFWIILFIPSWTTNPL